MQYRNNNYYDNVAVYKDEDTLAPSRYHVPLQLM